MSRTGRKTHITNRAALSLQLFLGANSSKENRQRELCHVPTPHYSALGVITPWLQDSTHLVSRMQWGDRQPSIHPPSFPPSMCKHNLEVSVSATRERFGEQERYFPFTPLFESDKDLQGHGLVPV